MKSTVAVQSECHDYQAASCVLAQNVIAAKKVASGAHLTWPCRSYFGVHPKTVVDGCNVRRHIESFFGAIIRGNHAEYMHQNITYCYNLV